MALSRFAARNDIARIWRRPEPGGADRSTSRDHPGRRKSGHRHGNGQHHRAYDGGVGQTTQLFFDPAVPTAATIPTGWDVVVNTGVAGSTLAGSNTDIIGGTAGGTYIVGGNSTVAAQGGQNTVSASGTYVLSFGPGTI